MPLDEITKIALEDFKTSDEVKEYIEQMLKDEEFMEHFETMFDYAREVAEEYFMSLRTRQSAVRGLVRFLSNLIW